MGFHETLPNLHPELIRKQSPDQRSPRSLSCKRLPRSTSACRLPLRTQSPAPKVTENHAYKPLVVNDEIRLLLLEPSRSYRAPLKGSLHHALLRDTVVGSTTPTYEALSYVWGSSDRVDQIATPDGHIPITKSLQSALRQVRNDRLPLLLWVDAICINQADDAERATQVQLMGRIYSSANRTLAHLGDATDSADAEAISLCIRVLRFTAKAHRSEMQFLNSQAGEVAERVVRLPWFGRAWIIQEFALAKEVDFVWAGNFINWTVFRDAFHDHKMSDLLFHSLRGGTKGPIVDSKHRYPTEIGQHRSIVRLMKIRRRCQNGDFDGGIPLYNVYIGLKETDFQSTIASDRLFALLGMVSNSSHELLTPDYSVPFETVLERYGARMLQEVGLRLLEHAGIGSAAWCGPSWLPNLNESDLECGLVSLFGGFRAGRPGSSSGEAQFSHKICTERDVLVFDGVIVDEIRDIGPELSFNQQGRSTLDHGSTPQWGISAFRRRFLPGMETCRTAAALEDLHLTFAEDRDQNCLPEVLRQILLSFRKLVDPIRHMRYPTKSDLLTVQLLVATHDRTRMEQDRHRVRYSPNERQWESDDESEDDGKDTPAHAIRRLKKVISWWTVPELEGEPTPRMVEKYLTYDKMVLDACGGFNFDSTVHSQTRFASTRKGYLGNVPQHTRRGDVVCVPVGGDAPLILRPSTVRPKMFQLVGISYVHGIMNGEALQSEHRLETVKVY